MDFLSLPFTTDFTSIAFIVLFVLAVCSVVVWVILFVKSFSLIRGKYLQLKALKYLEKTRRVGELRLLFKKMPKNPLQDMFNLGDYELRKFLKSNPKSAASPSYSWRNRRFLWSSGSKLRKSSNNVT